MSEQRQNPAVEDFDFIRTRIEQIKKEREEADKASNAPVMQPVFENDYCVGMASVEECNLASYNEILTNTLMNAATIDLFNLGGNDRGNDIGSEVAPRDWFVVAPDSYPMYDTIETLEEALS